VKGFISDPLLKVFGMPTRDELRKAGFDPEAYVAFDRNWYDGSIRGMDAEVGRLTETIRSLGMDRRTLVVFTGDHGEEFLEHGRTFHGQSTYGELNRVALMMWGPGSIPSGAVIGETVETVDVMPTLLDLSGLPIPEEAQGESLVPLLRPATPHRAGVASLVAADTEAGSGSGTSRPDGWRIRPAITEKAVTSDIDSPGPRDTEAFAIVMDGWKLIHNSRRSAGRPEFELYDHAKDPLNQVDLAGEHPDIVQRLSKELDSWKARASAARLKPDAESAESMDRESLERLRSLGYIQ
jgi:arylsulfatase A-like enzyme